MQNTYQIFFPEAFKETYLIVTDSNGCSVQVTEDELHEFKPNEDHIHVYYYGQKWWIHRSLHFPL
jgi:hypothetical protein